jgi:hypothetical protein
MTKKKPVMPPTRKVPTGTTVRGTPRKRVPQGEGPHYVTDTERDALVKVLRKLRQPATTRQLAVLHGIPTIKVRQVAYELQASKEVKLKKVGGALLIQPK